MKSFEEKKINGRQYYKNSFLTVTEDEVKLPDGNESKRVVVHHPGGVNIIALDEDKRLLLVEQFRYAIGKNTFETPAGKIEINEPSLITAKRELEEETGYTCETLVQIGKYASTPGFCNEYIENYFAEGLTKLNVLVEGDADEFINLHHVTKEEALMLIEKGYICDYKTIYAIQYLILHKDW